MGFSWTDDKEAESSPEEKDGCGLLALFVMLVPVAIAALAVAL